MKEANRVAVVDMGTNTFHLLVAELTNPPTIILRDSSAVKIGRGGINAGRIMPEGFNRAIKALKDFKASIDELNVDRVLAFGTSAIRNAANGSEFVQEIKKITGIESRIIDGDEEAELIYEGVRSALNLGSGKSLIVDVGGGSVEFIIANDNDIFWKGSFEVGGQRLLESFHHHDPIVPDEVEKLNAYLNDRLASLFRQLTVHQPRVLVGVSGTFDTLSEIYCHNKSLPYRPEDTETPLTIESFYQTYNLLVTRSREQRLAMAGMIEMRVDMIVVACCLVKMVLEKHQFDRVRVSTWSLKEGALMRLLGG